jgi:large repetitive protein
LTRRHLFKTPSWVPIALIAAVLAAVVSYAILASGFPVQKMDLNDTGIWVSRDGADPGGRYGRVNKAASAFDANMTPPGIRLASYELDILQDGNAVMGWDKSGAKLTPVNTAAGKWLTDQGVALDSSESVELRGGTLAILDQAGRVWASRYDPATGAAELSALDVTTAKPIAELGLPADAPAGSAALSVGIDGTIFVASLGGKLITISPTAAGFAAPSITEGRPQLKSIALTAVGSSVVAFDALSGTLVLPNGKPVALEIDPAARLQQPGPSDPGVLVATSKALTRVGLEAGKITTIDAGGAGAPTNPVRLGTCDFAAWAGSGRVVRACENADLDVQRVPGGLTRPVFRTNHSLILLNDQSDGRVYDLDTRADINWPTPNPNLNSTQETKSSGQEEESKPKANDDAFKARTERTTVLHPLDNDTNTVAGTLGITSLRVVAGTPDSVKLQISPDAQTVLISLPSGVPTVRFSYTISDGRAQATGEVSVTDAGTEETSPYLRDHYTEPSYAVASYGNLPIPPASDWRDAEGDPVSVVSASATGGAVPVTPEGVIDFTAAATEKEVSEQIDYLVSDGLGAPVKGLVHVRVLARNALAAIAAIAQPDVVRGEVGEPISLFPLNNDLPGADPRVLSARLALNGEVAKKAYLSVRTDVKSGQVLVVADREGTYFLEYAAGFGNATPTKGIIRVDALKAGSSSAPVAMPDQVAIRGQVPAQIDLLGNDYDPAGGLLTVQSATPAQPDDLRVQVIAGRWLRILPQVTAISPNPQAVHYTITNGSQEATGDVLVTQLPALEQDAPLVRDDVAVVRAGDSVLVSPTSNDTSLSGRTLSLATDNVGTGAAGKLTVLDPTKKADENQGDVGSAFIKGNQILYVAPTIVDAARQVVIGYTAQTNDGDTSDGRVLVTIKPAPSAEAPDQPPAPSAVEMRVVSGSRVRIPISTSGQDPDGDSVAVSGITSAPTLGRVVAFSPNSFTYEAYPGADMLGTDSFTYQVIDQYGRTGVGSIRVAVTAPGQTQPPVAVDDQIIARPGAEVQANVTANDYFARDDAVTIAPLTRLNKPVPEGVQLASDKGPIALKAPGVGDQPTVLNYALSGNGGTGPSATLTVVSKEGYNNPPIVTDQTAKVEGNLGKASLLEGAWDVDGSVEALKTQVLTPVEGLVQTGNDVAVPLLDHPQAVAFQVTDAGGAVSAAVVYVPAAGAGAPRLKAGGSIEIPTDSTATFTIGDYVESPSAKVVRISSPKIVAAPAADLEAQVTDANRFTVTAKNGYVGPASVIVEVMDADSQTAEGVLKATITIPVQVGAKTPVLRCPTDPQVIVQGGEVMNLDISSLCHVWSPDPAAVATLTYSADWAAPVSGVTATGNAHQVQLQAAGGAVPNSSGTLSIGILGTAAKPALLNVRVVAAAAPKLASLRSTDIKAGTPVTVPISLVSPLLDAQTAIVSVEKVSGGAAAESHTDGSVTITPDAATSGEVSYRVVATDLAADPSRQARWASGTITLVVYARPDAPTAPVSAPMVQSHSATVSWKAGKANGARIDSYEVRVFSGPKTGLTVQCRSTPCQVRGLDNGRPVTLKVHAHNKADWSEWSPASKPITPDILPAAPTAVTVSDPRDGSVLVSWGTIANDGSPLKKIHVSVDGRSIDAGPGASSIRVPNLDNNQEYSFTVTAENGLGIGPPTSARGQSSGRPLGLSVNDPKASDLVGPTTNVTISWDISSANGPKPVAYDVSRSDGKKICSSVTASSCVDDSVNFNGSTYTYRVQATNATGGEAHSATASSKAWQATGTPDSWGSWTASETGVNGQVRLNYTVPDPRGASATVSVLNHGSAIKSLGKQSGSQSYLLTSLNNGTGYSLQMRVCNEANRCTNSAANSATPFGPLSAPKASGSASGSTVNASATANGNGASATLRLYIDGSLVDTKSGSGAVSAAGSSTVGYSHTATVKAVLTTGATTPSRGDGGEDSTSVTTTAPPTSVSISRSSTRSTDTECTYYGGGRCPYVHLTMSGFSGVHMCTIYDDAGHWTNDASRRRNVTGNFDDILWYYGFNSNVWVTCGGVTSNTIHW